MAKGIKKGIKYYTSLFQEAKNLLCVIEDKIQYNLLKGFTQNIKQLESSYETNKKKCVRYKTYSS